MESFGAILLGGAVERVEVGVLLMHLMNPVMKIQNGACPLRCFVTVRWGLSDNPRPIDGDERDCDYGMIMINVYDQIGRRPKKQGIS